MRTRLRYVCQVNPATPEFVQLSNEAPVTFLPMEAVWPDERVNLTQRRSKDQVAVGYTRFKSGDVLVPKITPTFEAARSILVPTLDTKVGAGTTELHVLRPGPRIDGRYLCYVMHSVPFLRWGEAEMYGVAGQKRVPDDYIRDFVVDLPNLDEQRRIADFLSAEIARIDELDALRLRQVGLLGECLAARLDKAFNFGPSVPTVRLGYLARIQTGITVDASRVSDTDQVTLPYLRVANVQAGHLDLGEVAEIDVSRRKAAIFTLCSGDVLMTEGGDLDKLGRGTVWHGQIEECLHQNHVFAVRVNRRSLDAEYLALLTQTTAARAHFESTGNKTTNLASTSSSKIRDFRIPLPPLDRQRAVVTEVGVVSATVEAAVQGVQRQRNLLAERRQALITAAVTGKIDVTTARSIHAEIAS